MNAKKNPAQLTLRGAFGYPGGYEGRELHSWGVASAITQITFCEFARGIA